MTVAILVRTGFGSTPLDEAGLSESERDRLTSATRNPRENLEGEFEIERAIRNYGETIGIVFSDSQPDYNATVYYAFKEKGLLLEDERDLIATLGLPTPKTRPFSSLPDHPIFPFIVKNPESRKGREVYFLEHVEMLDKFRSFLNSSSAAVPSFGGTVSYDPRFEREKLICQEYVETPGTYFTTYRVLVSCTGTIFGSRITYSGNTKDSLDLLVPTIGDGWHKRDLLKSPDSPFYLASRKIVSNQSAGGGGIVLDPMPHSKQPNAQERLILQDHNLDPTCPRLPKLIREHSIAIADYLGSRQKGLLFGIDWIQSKDGNYYYLETNPSPASKPFIDAHLTGTETHAEAMIAMLNQIITELAKKHR